MRKRTSCDLLLCRRAGCVVRPVVFVSPLLTTFQETIDLRCCVLVVPFWFVLSGPPFIRSVCLFPVECHINVALRVLPLST